MDFEQDNDFLTYLVSFLGSLSVLPGNIISALLMDRMGRIKMMGELMRMPHLCSGVAGVRMQIIKAVESFFLEEILHRKPNR